MCSLALTRAGHQFSPWGWGCSRCTVLDPEMREGIQPWEYTLGASPPTQSPGDECFYFRFLESFGLFGTWKVTPHLHEKGWREDLALAVGQVMAPSCPWALTNRSVTRTSPYLGSGSEGDWGQSVKWSLGSGVARNSWQGQGSRPSLTAGRPCVAITPLSCTAAGV